MLYGYTTPNGPAPFDARTQKVFEDIHQAHKDVGTPMYDFTKETPNTHLSSVFPCTTTIRARITPFTSMYLLDFIDNKGNRVEGPTGVNVYTWREGGYEILKTLWQAYSWSQCKLEIYMLHPTAVYEIRSGGMVLNTIRFPHQVECVQPVQ